MSIYRSAESLFQARVNRRSLALGAGASVALAGLGTVSAQDATPSDEPFRVAFIYVGPIGDGGYTYAHDQGRIALGDALPNVETAYLENVLEVQADVERAVRGYAEEGYDAIVATSFGHGPGVLAVAPQFPDVQFIHVSGYQTADNVSTAFGRIEEARYVTGIVAGEMSESGSIGYVAAFPIPEVIRGINAFTLGAQSVNPDVTVQVVWTNTWYDPTVESAAAQSLVDLGVDVIAQHQDTPGPQQVAEAAGIYSVGYNTDMSQFAPDAVLTSAIWNWGAYYTWAVEQMLSGAWEGGNQYWGSWQDGVVDVAPIAEFVPAEVADAAMAVAAQFADGSMGVVDIFTGPILNQDGEEGIAEGVSYTDEEILNMNWFVQGVQGSVEG
jgi:basic membrane protein A and related proteins